MTELIIVDERGATTTREVENLDDLTPVSEQSPIPQTFHGGVIGVCQTTFVGLEAGKPLTGALAGFWGRGKLVVGSDGPWEISADAASVLKDILRPGDICHVHYDLADEGNNTYRFYRDGVLITWGGFYEGGKVPPAGERIEMPTTAEFVYHNF